MNNTPQPAATTVGVSMEAERQLLEEIAEETRLARQAEQSEASMIDRLSKLADGRRVFERRSEMLEAARVMAIRRTEPQDWVLFRDRQGTVTAMLTASGVGPVAEVFGISVTNIRPLGPDGEFQPLKIGEGKDYAYRAWADAVCRLNGRQVIGYEVTRSSTEDFIGRAAIDGTAPIVKEADLRSCLYTLLLTKPTRILASMIRVSPQELDAAWNGRKSSADCRKGSGFGTSTERTAESHTTADIKKLAAELASEILQRVGGDQEAAKKLLREITANPDKDFPGFDSAKRLTKKWQVDNAWKRLKEHPTFGDTPEPGTDG